MERFGQRFAGVLTPICCAAVSSINQLKPTSVGTGLPGQVPRDQAKYPCTRRSDLERHLSHRRN